MFNKIYKALGIKGISIVIAAFLLIVFCVQNNGPVEIDLFFWTLTEFPKLYLLFSLLIIGFIVGYVIGKFGFSKKETIESNSTGPNII
jgi:uncharacterized integral membrane protein